MVSRGTEDLASNAKALSNKIAVMSRGDLFTRAEKHISAPPKAPEADAEVSAAPMWLMGGAEADVAMDVPQEMREPSASDEARQVIQKAFALVKEAERRVHYDPTCKEVILVVGNTGTGKSTLVQFMASDQSKLYAVEYPVGTGRLVIQDKDDLISSAGSSAESKTLFPDLVFSTTGDLAFYDCPGFKDTRGTAVDLAVSFLTKKVFDNAQRIKVLICVEYETAIGANGRAAPYIEAMRHVGEFVKDTAKFALSFCMVATKVSKETKEDEDGNDVPVPDASIIEGVGDFIVREGVPLLQKRALNETSPKQRKITENALGVLSALSAKKDGSYHRIALFRKPQQKGPLSKSKLMQKSRAGILAAVTEETQYAPVHKSDFGYTVADGTKVEMLNIAHGLNQSISEGFKTLVETIRVGVLERIGASRDWTQLIIFLENFHAGLSQRAVELDSIETLSPEFLALLSATLKHARLDVAAGKLSHLDQHASYLEFLEAILEQSLGVVPKGALAPSLLFLAQMQSWYRSLYSVLEALSADKVQADTSLYNVAQLSEWGQSGREQGLRVSAHNLPAFFKLINIHAQDLEKLDLSEERMNELAQVIHFALVPKAEVGLSGDGVLVAKGAFVRLSHVVRKYKEQESGVKAIHVFASCAVYLDAALEAPGRNVVVAAPTWHVSPDACIKLDGLGGEGRGGVAPDGRGANPGESGHPGGCGASAGHFVGIAAAVVNGGHLTISANGGDGGRGQGGGRGGDGAAGVDGAAPSNRDTGKPYGSQNVDWWELSYRRKDQAFCMIHDWEFRIKAKALATDGQRGGDGGAGGEGGFKGQILLSLFSGGESVKVRSQDGNAGGAGEGGKGGDMAKHGDDIKALYYIHKDGFDAVWYRWGWEDRQAVYSNGYSQPGSAGLGGGNRAGQERPKAQERVLAPFVNDFKGFAVVAAAGSPLMRHSLEGLLKQMDAAQNVNVLYDVEGFLHETTTLESHFYAIYSRIDTAPYYDSILRRVTAFAEAKKATTDKAQRLTLATIYAACLGKLCALRIESAETSLIIDLETYIGLTMQRLEALNTEHRADAIRQFQAAYKQEIDGKVSEANELMDKRITPVIDKTMQGMDETLDALVAETLKKQAEAKSTIEELKIQQEEMQKALILKGMLNVLKMIGMVASFLGPIGAAVGGVVTAGATVGESFVPEPGAKPNTAILVPPGTLEGLKGLTNLTAAIRGRKIEALQAQLSLTQDALAGLEKAEKAGLTDLDASIVAIKAKLAGEEKRKVGADDDAAAQSQLEAVRALEKELKSSLKQKEGALKEAVAKGDASKQSALQVIGRVERGLRVVEAGLDTYNKVKADKRKLDSIGHSLREADKALGQLQDYERSIHTHMFPMVRKMREDVKQVQASLYTKSQVALDVTKWEIQSTLTTIRRTLQKCMEGYKSHAEVSLCFTKLEEALTLLIQIYDRLQSYKDQQRLGDYMGNLGAPGEYTDLLKGSPCEGGVRSLHMAIQANLLLLEFDAAMAAFRQWVFPFARIYVEKFFLPPTLKAVQDTESLRSLVATANAQLGSTRADVARYWATIPNYDKFFYEATFDSEEKVGGPFFVWPKETFASQIAGLLSGEEVSLLADVRGSAEHVRHRRAIKFQKVFLRFRLHSEDADRLAAFESLLDYFVVHMLHSGTNYYAFQDDVYVIPGPPVTLSYAVLGARDGEPQIISASRTKVLSGDLLLSPYTLWSLRLSAERAEKLEELQPYAKDVSLELTGRGKFIWDVKQELSTLDLRVNDYYDRDGRHT